MSKYRPHHPKQGTRSHRHGGTLGLARRTANVQIWSKQPKVPGVARARNLPLKVMARFRGLIL